MNEFIEQFLVEARELVEQATGDLLALEQKPDDQGRLDSAFRAFHTLKGAAGIIEFDAMARALHAAEDGLSAVRAGDRALTTALMSDAFTVLDQVSLWLEAIEAAGEPPKDADHAADALASRFSAAPAPPARPGLPPGWLETLRAENPAVLSTARTAFAYQPQETSFFDGEDPLEQIRAAPGLLALGLIPPEASLLDGFDPFACRLIVTGLSSEPPEAITAALGARGLTVRVLGDGAAELDSTTRNILQAQVRMLQGAREEGLDGRVGAAARAAASALSAAGKGEHARGIEAAGAGGASALIMALQAVLEGRPFKPTPPNHPAPASGDAPEPVIRSLRVEAERIDALVRLTGEFMVLKNSIAHLTGLATGGSDGATWAEPLKIQQLQFERLVGELQQAVLHLRVLPIRQVFQRFPRLMRELGATLGKPVRLIMEGEDTEADKAIVEALFEPLLHVVRNAIDHGLEPEDVRVAAGKPPVGLIALRAFRQAEEVVIEVEDDGAGVDVERVRALAAERGLADGATLATMADAEIVDLIFAPGFSTAATVSSLSGRGVGMDAVRTAMGRLGGRVVVDSRQGQGSIVRLTLPFTIMLTRVMTVEAGGQAFGLPIEVVIETLRLPRRDITIIGAACAFDFRGRTTPLLRLDQALGADAPPRTGEEALIVVVEAGEQPVGFEVDRLLDQMEIMLKPMDGLLSGMAGVAGTTLTGDGRVLLVLDVAALVA